MPDIEDRFWNRYRADGLEVVALDANDTIDQIAQVQDFCSNLGVTYTVGLEEGTNTYGQLAANFEGLNPFPIDVLLDKTGKIRYVAREYDADELDSLVQELLAE